MRMIKMTALFLAIFTYSLSSVASTNWSDVSITYLYGELTNIGDAQDYQAETVTLEYAASYSWGDAFAFVDKYFSKSTDINNDNIYMEVSPNVSLNKVIGRDQGGGLVKDIYLFSFSWEHGSGADLKGVDYGHYLFDNYLYGAGLSWNVPGALFFKTIIYHRINELTANNQQLNFTFSFPFKVGKFSFLFDGYADITNDISGGCFTCKGFFHFNPQFSLDVSAFWGQAGDMFVGFEYDYWDNKLGVDGVEQNTFEFLIKYHL